MCFSQEEDADVAETCDDEVGSDQIFPFLGDIALCLSVMFISVG